MSVKSVVFPPRKEIEIGGEMHPLRPLRVRDVVDLLGILSRVLEQAPGLSSGDMGAIIQGSGEAADLILRRTFPTFTGWESMGAEQELALLEIVLTEGNLLDAIRSFGPAVARLTQAAAGILTPAQA